MTSSRRWAEFASRLKKARKNAGLTVREVADKNSVPYARYSKWELGARMPADVDKISELAASLSVSPSWLAFGLTEAEPASIEGRLSRVEAELKSIRLLLERVFRK